MLQDKVLISALTALAASAVQVSAHPFGKLSKRCSTTLTDYSDVSDAVSGGCDITLGPLTVPSGEALDLSDLSDGVTVTVAGDVTFESGTDWEGPMFLIGGSDITFDGGGNTFNGNGQDYWDGEGSNGGVTKPKMMKMYMGGTFSNLVILNSPVQTFSVGNKEALTIDSITIDNSAGDSGGGHNTDGFDVSNDEAVTIQNCVVYNQDDCLAINSGSSITFSNNYCSGGHGISIGSIKSDKTVSDVTISGNTVVNSANGFRIKTVSGATGGSVTDVTYSDNCASNISTYGVDIQQDYENGSPTGTATDGIEISGITFSGTNTVEVADGADEVYILCGDCTGTWDWSGLTTSGGDAGSASGAPDITGYTLP